jgi:hypothetical protein
MLRQTVVTNHPSISQAGKEFSNTRHTAIYSSAVNQDNDVLPGVAQVVVGNYDYTRDNVKDLTAARLAAANAKLVINMDCGTVALCHKRTPWYAATSQREASITPRYEHMRVLVSGDVYIVVEKAINPANPVYVRVANGVITPGLVNGIGFFSDTASADHVLVPSARWIATDTASHLFTKDTAITPAVERDRMGMTCGYGIAPIEFRGYGYSQPGI